MTIAPNAEKVELTGNFLYVGKDTPDKYADGDWRPQLMNKDANGRWTLTTPPLKPEFYSYNLIVDGVKITDPKNIYTVRSTCWRWCRWVICCKECAPWNC